MQRRTFLSLVPAVIAAAAWPRGSQAAAERTAPLSSPSRSIRIGMSAAFKGTAAGLGTEFYRGAQAYYSEVNARGGVHGRPITVVALNDGYEPTPCIHNTVRLIEREEAFVLSNYVGTPTLTRALPVIRRYAAQHVLLVGNLTGAQPQRESPYADSVFNIRASYRQEMMALVDRFWAQGARKFGVFYQIDAYGRSGADGVSRGLAVRGARIVAEATYPRGATFEHDMSAAVRALQHAGADVVLCTGAYQGCGAFVRTARDLGWNVPISNLSFVGADALLALLVKHGRERSRDYTRALVNSQVVPSYDDTSLPGVNEYRALMDRWEPSVPEELRDTRYAWQKHSFPGLEGFINARVIVEALRRAGPNPTRLAFRRSLESLRGLDLGIGTPLTFTAERHQGLDSVHFTRVDDERWVPLTSWSAVVKA